MLTLWWVLKCLRAPRGPGYCTLVFLRSPCPLRSLNPSPTLLQVKCTWMKILSSKQGDPEVEEPCTQRECKRIQKRRKENWKAELSPVADLTSSLLWSGQIWLHIATMVCCLETGFNWQSQSTINGNLDKSCFQPVGRGDIGGQMKLSQGSPLTIGKHRCLHYDSWQ